MGRAREFDSLLARYRAATSGEHQVCRVTGEMGVGKTRLVQELAAAVAAEGGRVCWVRLTEGAPPLWPWAQVVRSLATCELPRPSMGTVGSRSDELTHLLHGWRHDGGRVSAARLGDALADLIARASQSQPLLLVLDDVQRAKPLTAGVLAALEQSLAGASVLLVLAYRDEELGPDLADLLDAGPGGGAIRLDGMRGSDLGTLVALELDADPASTLVDAVGRVSAGNPAFVQESVHALRLAGDVDTAGDTLPVPEGVRRLVVNRLARLDVDERVLLRVAACFGDLIDSDLVAAVTGTEAAAVRSVFRRAAERRLVAQAGAGVWRFASQGVR
ncbi:MAG: AAA family ATPase, partial [Acidimicrobiales bacterium]